MKKLGLLLTMILTAVGLLFTSITGDTLAAGSAQFTLSHDKVKFVTKTQANSGLSIKVTNSGEDVIEYRAYMSDKSGNEIAVDHFSLNGNVTAELNSGASSSFTVRLTNDCSTFIDEYFTVEAWIKGEPENTTKKTVTVSYDNTIVFTKQPSGGTTLNGKDFSVSWACDPMPEKPEDGLLQMYREGYDDWFIIDYVNTSPAVIPYDATMQNSTQRFRIDVWGDLGKHYTSREFEVTWEEAKFTQQPKSGTVAVNEDYEVSWKLNFVPVSVNVQIMHDGSWEHFKGASATGVTIDGYGEEAVRTFRVVAFNNDVSVFSNTFTVTYEQEKSIIVYCDPMQGSCKANPSSAIKGTEITLSATPKEGFVFDKWIVETGGVTISNNKFILGDENVRIHCLFKEDFENAQVVTEQFKSGFAGDEYYFQLEASGNKPYTWSLPIESLPEGLTLDPATGVVSGIPSVFHGSVTVRVENRGPNGTIRADDRSLTFYIYQKPFFKEETFLNGKEKVEYRSSIAMDTSNYPASVKASVASGSLPDGLKVSTEGKNIVLAGTPTKTGTFKFTLKADVTINNDITWSGTKEYTIVIETAIHTILVTSSGNGTAQASITSGPVGTQVTLTATPDPDYQFARWEIISGGVKIKNNKFTLGDEDVQIVAHFEKIPYWFAIYNSRSVNGKVSVDGTEWDNSAGDDFPVGMQVTAYAAPDEGYHFVRWEDESGKAISTNKNYTFIIREDTILYAIFAENDEITIQIRYDLTSGNHATWRKGSIGDLKFSIRRSPADESALAHLNEIKVDNIGLNDSQFTASGNDIILKREMLESLSEGSHKLQLVFDDYLGPEGTFTILEAEQPKNNSLEWMWILPGLLLAAGAGILMLLRMRKED